MGDNSAIEWTDATWNPVRGCDQVSPGCAHCYAETFAERFRGVAGHPYEQGFDLRVVLAKVREPLRWPRPRRVFVNSMSDLFHEAVPETFILDVYTTMQLAHWHTFQVLTKRHERARDVLRWVGRKFADMGELFPLPNVWQGVSVENQLWADQRVPVLLETPASHRFVSAEPLLGPVDLRDWCKLFRNDHIVDPTGAAYESLDWVIVGGESGSMARQFDIAWARAIVEQCRATGTPVFVKQLGAKPVGNWDAVDNPAYPRGRLWSLKSRKGGDMGEWPSDLQVREFPA